MAIEAPETQVVTSWKIACDGGEGALGHPRVWLTIPEDKGWVECGYCDKRFVIDRAADIPDLPRYLAFLRRHRVEVAAVEFLVDAAGKAWTYDLNINTNYNAVAEAAAGVSGMAAIAAFLARTLAGDASPLLQANAA